MAKSPFGSMPKGKSAPSTKQQPAKSNSHKPSGGAKKSVSTGISPGIGNKKAVGY